MLSHPNGRTRHLAVPSHSHHPTPDHSATSAAEVAHSLKENSCSSDAETSADANCNVPAPQALSVISSVHREKLHTLPHQCKGSVLIHGHLQGLVPIAKLHAAAADCYSGHEAWLEASTISSIRSKAVLSLNPDKNPQLPAAYCNNLFAEFHKRVNDLLNSKDDTVFWASLVHESVAAVAYLSFCHGQATSETC